jgi:AcrR family transcriptional regulator
MTSGPQHPPTPRQRVAEARRRQTQRRLIDAARIVLAEQGVESTRIQEITARAGVGFGSFYNYFASKEVAAVMTATAATLTTALERATEDVADSALAVSIANRFWVRVCWVEPLWARLP